MPDYSLVPVNHQPDFGDYSLIPVDHDPFAADGVTQQAQVQLAQAQPQGPPQQQPATGAVQPDADAPAAGGYPNGSVGGGIGPTARVPNPTLDQGAAKAAPFGGHASPTQTDSLPSNGGPIPLLEHGKVDSYFYAKNATGTPPEGPQVTTANRNLTITATDNAEPTNFGGVYGHTLTFSEPGSNNLRIITAADPTGLLVATPVEGNPNLLSVREYKGYKMTAQTGQKKRISGPPTQPSLQALVCRSEDMVRITGETMERSYEASEDRDTRAFTNRDGDRWAGCGLRNFR